MAMKSKIAAIALAVVAASGTLLADTLVLRDGRRVQGELIGVYGREIEFEERSGSGRRAMRIPRQDIVRIEFDNQGSFPFGQQQDNFPFGNQDGGGIPRGMRERNVNVTAREAWTDTGVDVRAGQTIYFQPSGEWRWGPNRRDGAGGENGSPFNRLRPMPNQPAAALIGRIGDDQGAFIIGSDPRPVRARAAGRLYLGINDDVLDDNTGSLRVVVAY